MAENEWIFDAKYNSWFYLDENGHYVENARVYNILCKLKKRV